MNFNCESNPIGFNNACKRYRWSTRYDWQCKRWFRTRTTAASNSAEIDLLGALCLDFMFQERYLLNHVDVKLHFSRSKDAFCIIAAENST